MSVLQMLGSCNAAMAMALPSASFLCGDQSQACQSSGLPLAQRCLMSSHPLLLQMATTLPDASVWITKIFALSVGMQFCTRSLLLSVRDVS